MEQKWIEFAEWCIARAVALATRANQSAVEEKAVRFGYDARMASQYAREAQAALEAAKTARFPEGVIRNCRVASRLCRTVAKFAATAECIDPNDAQAMRKVAFLNEEALQSEWIEKEKLGG